MAIVQIKIQETEIDLYDNEKIVQSFSLINIEDITKRESEYSNTFKVPKTNKNLQVLEYADFLNSTSSLPYSRLFCEILIDGFPFKKGFISIESIDEDISLRFFTGNAGFYEIIKNRSINQINPVNTPSLTTTWNLPNVVAKRNTSQGIIFALIDYNGMPTNTTTVDVRLLLPSFYRKTLIEGLIEDAGYTLINNIENSIEAYNNDIIPTAKNNLRNLESTINDKSYKGSILLTQIYRVIKNIGYPTTWGLSFELIYPYLYFMFDNYLQYNINNYYTTGNFNNPNNYFIANQTGIFDVTVDMDMVIEHTERWTNFYAQVPKHKVRNTLRLLVFINNIPAYEIDKIVHEYNNPSVIDGVNGINIYSWNYSINKTVKVTANNGDKLKIGFESVSYFYGDRDINFLGSDISSRLTYTPTSNSFAEFKLGEGLTFGETVSTQNCLTDIKQSDFFKDTCIRYGLIPIVDEDLKKVTLYEFSQIKDNITNAVDWSNKLDETKDWELVFKIDSYGQNNYLNHKEDKFVLSPPRGSNGVITISNQNLDLEKKLYESPFAASTNVERLNGKSVMYIDLHDGVSLTNTSSFKNGVTARTGYVEFDNFSVSYTDGTTTTIVSNNIPLTWFIDSSKTYSAGFQSNLLDYSADIIAILQNLKKVKCEIRLNILDIINLNYFYPIYIDEFNSYFFLSKINQFDYTSNDSTTVELIKLN